MIDQSDLMHAPRYMAKAMAFADFTHSEKGRSMYDLPDHPASLFEGLAGGLCFYADCLQPMDALFPGFDV